MIMWVKPIEKIIKNKESVKKTLQQFLEIVYD